MCIICVDFQKGNLTVIEAKRNYREMLSTIDKDHAEEILEMIKKREKKEKREQLKYYLP